MILPAVPRPRHRPDGRLCLPPGSSAAAPPFRLRVKAWPDIDLHRLCREWTPRQLCQTAISLGGVLNQRLREIEPAVERLADQVPAKPPDAPTPTPARDVPSRH